MISNQTISKIKSLDLSTSVSITNALNQNLDKLTLTGCLLDEAFSLSYYQYTKLLIRIVRCSNIKKKNELIKKINSFDTSIYCSYGCRARYVAGYKQAIKHFNKVIELFDSTRNISYKN